MRAKKRRTSASAQPTELSPVPAIEVLEDRTLLAVPHPFDLTTLTGANGFRIPGSAEFDQTGGSVANAGDVNGDGFDDFIVGNPRADTTPSAIPNSLEGSSYVVFGIGGAAPSVFNPAVLNGANGFRLDGISEDDLAGTQVQSAGDVNGDGFDDLLVGAPRGLNDGGTGAAFVLFGRSVFPASMNLSGLTGSDGFRISGVDVGEQTGYTVSSAGDINNDGLTDIIVGAHRADPEVTPDEPDAGRAYVVLGRTGGYPAILDLATLDGTNGFRIEGSIGYSLTGISVSSAGDFNGDGRADIIIGAPQHQTPATFDPPGGAYLIFGTTSNFPAVVDLATINGNNGFRMQGVGSDDATGFSVSGVGDFNGDGFDDVIIGAPEFEFGSVDPPGKAFVVFGTSAAFPAAMSLSALNGANGFRIDGLSTDDEFGFSVAGAGDFNGDGFDDVIVGGRSGNRRNLGVSTGEAYVVFGASGGFGGAFSVDSLDGMNGFRVDGFAFGDAFGASVGGGGDFNGDGFGDIIIGAPGREQGILDNAGEAYVIFGGDYTNSVTHLGTSGDDEIFADENSNVMVGGRGDDVLHGLGGGDVLIGGEGDDILRVRDMSFERIVGGNGFDTLKFFDTEGSFNIDLTAIPDNRITGIEQIDITSLPNSIKITPQEVLNISDHSNELRIIHNFVDIVDIGPIGGPNGWARQPDEVIGEMTFVVYHFGNAILKTTILNEPPSDIILDNDTIPENQDTTNPVLVGNLSAVDIDTTDVHTFALVPGDGDIDNHFFEIINNGLYFKAGTDLDFETQNRFVIRILTDDGEDTLEENFEILLTDVNDPPSDIVLANNTIPEDASTAIQVLVGTFTVLDQDVGDFSQVSFVPGPGDTDNPLFQINENRLELRARIPIDFETKPTYTVRLQADDGEATFEKAFTIQILDVNEPPSNLVLDQTSIDENIDTTLPVSIGTFSASDPDVGAVLSYSLVLGEGSDDNAAFQINGSNLELRAGEIVDHEAQNSYSIRVRVHDGTNFIDEIVIITVNDINEGPPTGITLPDNTVDENNDPALPADVGTLVAIDDDGPDTHTFSLVTGTGDGDNASFQIEGNVLQVRPGVSLNFEARSTYFIRVRVDDPDSSFEQPLTVLVGDVNEPPTAIDLSNDTINENVSTATNVLIGSLQADDVDAVQNHTFSLVPGTGSGDNGSFIIAGNQLLVRAGTTLDHEQRDSFSIRVRVDDGPHQFEQSLTVFVADLNEGPVSNLQLSNDSVAENSDTAGGLAVGTLFATDIDGADTHTFSLAAGTGDTDNADFRIVGNTLEFQPGTVLDHEVQSQYSVRVRVTDGLSSTFGIFTVQVTDQNDPPHDITLSNNQVDENLDTSAGVLVGTLGALDQDAADSHTFALVAGGGDDDNGLFQIVGDRLELRPGTVIDFETQSTMSIRVVADDGELSLEKPFTISVADLNDAPTAISLDNDSIPESTSTGPDNVIGNLLADDQDAGDSHVFRLVSGEGDTDNARFTIQGDQLVLLAGPLLDHETQPEFSVRIETEDSAGALFSQAVTVHVADVNEGFPTDILLDSAEVPENSDTSAPLLAGTLIAIDADTRELHQFELIPGAGSADNGKFQITGNRLEFRPGTVLDFETQGTFAVRVRATDQSLTSVERSLTVTIVNVNEGPKLIGPSGVVLTNQPTFSWEAVPNADHYNLWVNNLTTGQIAVIFTDVVGTTFVPNTPLNNAHSYIWTVRAFNAAGVGGESAAHRVFTVNPPLPAPTPVSPVGVTTTTLPLFSWSALPGAAQYELLMNNFTTGEALVLNVTGLTTNSFAPTAELTNGHRYQWTVRGVTADGAGGTYMPTQFFTVDKPPARPVTIGPFSFIETPRPTFTWNPVHGAVRYEIWVNDQTTGQSAIIRHTDLTTTSFTPPMDLEDRHSYIWTVHAYDAQGRRSEHATHKTFRVQMPAPTPPPVPTLTGPGSVVDTTFPTFTWTEVPGAVRYDLWVNNRTTNQSAVIRNVSILSGSFTPSVPLENGHEYIWTVAAISDIGLVSSQAPHRIFRVEAPAPAAPVPLQPGTESEMRPTFSWSSVPDAVEYDLWVNDQTAGINAVIREKHLPTNSFVPNFDLVPGHYYIWTVRAINAQGAAGDWAKHRVFLAAPALPAPTITGTIGTVHTARPTFTWSAITGANRYDIWVNDLTTGQSAVIRNMRVFGNQFTPTVDLVNNHSYIWTVRGITASGDGGSWAKHQIFTVRLAQLDSLASPSRDDLDAATGRSDEGDDLFQTESGTASVPLAQARAIAPPEHRPEEIDRVMAGWSKTSWWETTQQDS